MNNLFVHSNINPELTLFVGIGNRFKRDDQVGIYICELLKKNSEWKVVIAENGLENHIGKINKMNPEKLIIADALNFNREPGYYDLIPISDIQDETSNTHTVSLRYLTGLLTVVDVNVLGIQPQNISFGTSMSAKVITSANIIVNHFLTLANLNLNQNPSP